MAEPLAYNTNLKADIKTVVSSDPKARVHSREWVKVINGDPVEINPSVGFGYKVHQHISKAAARRRNHNICVVVVRIWLFGPSYYIPCCVC